jgi:hypothetical protein
MPDLSDDSDSYRLPLALTTRSSSDATLAMRMYDSSPAFESATTLGDAFANTKSTNLSKITPTRPSSEDGVSPFRHLCEPFSIIKAKKDGAS